nr:hypothetical protein [Porphyromonas gingivalis]
MPPNCQLFSVHVTTFFSTRRFGSGSEKFSRHSEKILAPLFPKTHSAIRAFPVCELRRGGFVRKGKFGRFRGRGQARRKILETFARRLVCILFVNSLYNRELFCIFEH